MSIKNNHLGEGECKMLQVGKKNKCTFPRAAVYPEPMRRTADVGLPASFFAAARSYIVGTSGQMNTSNRDEKCSSGFVSGSLIPLACAIVLVAISASASCNGQGT